MSEAGFESDSRDTVAMDETRQLGPLAVPIHTRSLRSHGRIGLEDVRWKSASRDS